MVKGFENKNLNGPSDHFVKKLTHVILNSWNLLNETYWELFWNVTNSHFYFQATLVTTVWKMKI